MIQRSVARAARALSTTALSAALVLTAGSVAVAGGSDAPPPYQVTATGLVLPDGATFARHGHVNVRWTSASGEGSRNMHLGGPDSPWHDVEGTSAVTWARLGLPADACIVWVQVHGYNEHFGEGGQAPVCRTTPAPEPVPPVDDVPITPAPQPPTEPETPQPPTEPQTPEAPAPPPGDDGAAPTEPDESDDTTPAPVLGAPAAGAPTPPMTAVAAAEQVPPLAATGSSASPLAAVAAAAVLLGAGLLLARRLLGHTPGRHVVTARGAVT